jgi:hypothetical protein
MSNALQIRLPKLHLFSMGKNDDGTISKEFKIQIAYITAGFVLAFGSGLQAHLSMQKEVEELRKSNDAKTESLIRIEGKFDLLNLQIKQLQERLEAKKIVNGSVFDASQLSGADWVRK